MTEEHTLSFCMVEVDGKLVVRLSIDGAAALETKLDLDWRFQSEDAKRLKLLQNGKGSDQDLPMLGVQLWTSLLGDGEARQQVKALRKRQRDEGVRLVLRLEVPPGLDDLPWEAIYDEAGQCFLAQYDRCTVIRDPPGSYEVAPLRTKNAERLRMLIVIPEGSGLNVQGELRGLEAALLPVMHAIEGALEADPPGPRRLTGRVTSERLYEELRTGRWDIVHFIGHGSVSQAGTVKLRLNDANGDDDWKASVEVVPMFQNAGVQLVVLNACAAGAASTKAGLAGLAPAMLANGVSAVVAMRHDVEDKVAILFAGAFYRELFTGQPAGRADRAVQVGRAAVLRNFGSQDPRAFVTPILFQAPEGAALFELDVRERAAPQGVILPPPSRVTLPAKLIDAVRERRCVPIVGPGLLPSPRGDGDGATMYAIARKLARTCADFPDAGELALAGQAGEWLHLLLLQRVCQHFEETSERFLLTEAVLEACAPQGEIPPALLAIARWKVPGAVCTHFDATLQRAFETVEPMFRTVYGITESPGPGGGSLPLLVHLRGSVRSPDSLVLTERDHDVLWDRMDDKPTALSTDVASLTAGGTRGRSLLFLGVSPRDTWVRRLARRLLPPTLVNAGRVFFVGKKSIVDEASWHSLREPIWIDADPAAVVMELSRP